MAITMETDWGAKGAQLTGGQVQTFIKEQLIALQKKSEELQQKIEAIGPTPEGEQLKQELEGVKKAMEELQLKFDQVDVTPDWLETDKASKSYIKNKPEIVTLDHVPGPDDKSYVNRDGTTVNFAVGDVIRYKDEDGKYKFYRVNDISPDGTIEWGEEGSGSGEVNLKEKLTVNVTSNQAQPDDSLKGATVTVRGTDGNTYYSGQWDGNPIQVEVDPMVEYSVSASDIEGYATPVAQKYTSSIQGTREVSLMYSCCILTVNIIGLTASSVQAIVSYDSKQFKVNSGETIKVPYGKSITVSCPKVDNYVEPAQQSFTLSQSNHIVYMQYVATSFKLTIDSNQPDKNDLRSLTATLSYAGQSKQIASGEMVSVPANTQVTVSFSELEGYKKPADIIFTNNGGLIERTGTYLTEVVKVTINADNGQSMAGQTVTIGSQQFTWQGTEISKKIPHGTQYSVSVNEKDDYIAPEQQTFTAGQVSRSVTMQYKYNPIKSGYFILDDTVSDPATKIVQTAEGRNIIHWIRQNSHRVLAKKIAEGKCRVIQLMDNDTTKYFDGQSAPITNTNYDVMMMMPEFWYASELVSLNQWKIWLADGDPKDGKKWKKWDHGHLIGVYEAYVEGSKMYSISGKNSSGSVSQATFKQYARNKGDGYMAIDWQAHCIMAVLFWGYHENTNSQAICGSGTNSDSKQTGQTNSNGMSDTDSYNGNSGSINFWGLENWWGNKYEFIDNVVVDKTDSYNDTWKITEPNGSVRNVKVEHISSGYISQLAIGEYLDIIPIASDGSSSTGHCDYFYPPSSSSRVVLRSNDGSYSVGGVSYAGADDDSSDTYSNSGSRLAFIGEIVEASSVSEFTA